MADTDDDIIKSEINHFKTTHAYGKIREYLQRRIDEAQNVLNIDLKGDIIAQVSESRGICDTAKRLMHFIDHMGD